MKGINTMKVTRMMMGMAAVVAGLLFSSLAHAGDAPITPSVVPGRWSADKAWQWYNQQPWPCGFNYVPANAVSYTEMWMDYNFNPELIDKELAVAEGVGFNCLRVILPFVVWEKEPEAFKKRLSAFLDICHKRRIKVMLGLFDDCAFGPIKDPVFGKQPDMVLGWYSNAWTPSPGHSMVRDASTWPRLEKYVTDLLTTFGKDQRVWVWDLYNEPGNGGLGVTVPLVAKVFEWARQVNPVQPLTVGLWCSTGYAVAEMNSDIITFHNYKVPDQLRRDIMGKKNSKRPMICTEWMHRKDGSTVEGCLPVLRENKVGSMNWGLVNGKTQTHLNWGHRPGQPDPKVWQHDLFRPDYTPYDPKEIELFKAAIRENSEQR
jgi:hypothetical protein